MDEKRVFSMFQDTRIKALGNGRIGGYLVAFGDEDDRDLYDEFFTSETDFMLDAYPIVGAPIFLNHTQDGILKSIKIGEIDELLQDKVGLWVAGILQEREEYLEYIEAVEKMVAKGILDWSSGSVAHIVEVAENGHIKRWPVIEGSPTPTPAQPRKTAIEPIKSQILTLDEYMDYIKSAKEGAIASIPIVVSGNESGEPSDNQSNNQNDKQPNEVNSMNIKLQEVVKRFAAAKAISEEDAQLLLDGIAGVISGMVDGEDDMSEEEATESVEDVAERALAEIEGSGKSITSETVETILAEKFDELMKPVEDRMQKRYERKMVLADKQRQSRESAQERAKANMPRQSPKERAGGFDKKQDGTPRGISIAEERRFSNLSASDMVLGAKIKAAAYFPHGMPEGVTLGQLGLSDGYINTMVGKIGSEMERDNRASKSVAPLDGMRNSDSFALKSAMRGMKANELDAVEATNQGAEWAFVWYDTDLWERGRPETALFDMMVSRGMQTVDVPGKAMNVKLNTSSPTVYTVGEARSVGADGNPEAVVQITPWGTDEVEENVQYHVLATSYTDQLAEQSIIDIVQFVNSDATVTMQEAMEDALINGDKTTTTANINTDGTPGTGMQKPLYLAWDGIRHNWLIDNTTQRGDAGGSLVIEDYLDTWALFDQPLQARHSNMLYVIDSAVETATRKLADLQTVNVAGESRATIFHGALPPLFGIDIYTSGLARKSQADGTIAALAASNTTGTINCVYAPYWQYGRQRAIQVELQRAPLSLSTVVVVSMGHVLKARGADAACGTRNVGV